MTEVFSLIGLLVSLPLLLGLGAVLNGWALSLMWAWFIIPVFSLPSISIGQAIGIGMIASFVTWQQQAEDKTKDEDALVTFFRCVFLIIFRPLITVGIAYLVKQFI